MAKVVKIRRIFVTFVRIYFSSAMEIPRIDVAATLAAKAPRAARWIPRPVVGWLRRTVHEQEMNEILERVWQLPPVEFIRSFFDYMQITFDTEGLNRLDPGGRYLFVSNHPFGGMDGMMLAERLIDRFGDVRVVVNDILMAVQPLRPLWLPVNKHGAQNADYARRYDEAFLSPLPVLTFPAGLCSRRRDGRVCDLEWKTNFIKQAHRTGRDVVPVFVEGELSDFFYRLANIRKALGIKFNIEMLWLVDEMFRQRGRHFILRFGAPIPHERLSALGSRREQTAYVRRQVYALAPPLP